MRFYMSCAAVAALRIKSSHFFIGSAILAYCKTNIDECFSILHLDRIITLDREKLIPHLPDSINLETHNDVFFQNVYIDLSSLIQFSKSDLELAYRLMYVAVTRAAKDIKILL